MSDIRTFKLFQLTAKLGSISKAADTQHIDRTSAGRRLDQLENYFGKKLLIRNHGGVELTPEGKEAFKNIGTLLALEEDIRYGKNNNKKTLQIVSTHSLISNYLSPIVAQFIKNHPDIQVHLIADDKGTLLDKVEFDCCFHSSAVSFKIPVKKHKVTSMKRGIYASEQYLKERGYIKSLSELPSHKFIVFGSESEYILGLTAWPLYLNADDLDLPQSSIVASVNSVEAMVRMAEAGVGAIGISDHIIQTLQSSLINIAPDAHKNEYDLYMYWHDRKQTSVAVDAFLSFMRKTPTSF